MINEKNIQKYIWDNKDNFSDFLVEPEFPSFANKKPWEFSPAELLYSQIIKKYVDIWNSMKEHYFFGYEVPLKKDNDTTVRADFLGILAGRNGIVVTELKKSEQTERQAYTELLAYGSHLRAIFSPMSKMDIVYLLIAPMKERIVREATINSLLYDRNEVCALIPSWEDEDLTTLKLKGWIPSFEEFNHLTAACFSESNFDVFKVTWDGLPGEWSPEKKGDNPDKYMIKRMNKVSSLASQIMEAKGIHGFVFCSQTWSELRDTGHLINGVIIGGINPYKATKNRILLNEHGLTAKEADKVDIGYIDMLTIIPELKNFAEKENTETNFLSDLSMTWPNEIIGIGFEVVDILTKSLKRDWIETSHGGFDWKTYQRIYQEDIYCHNFEIKTTGIIRELFFDYSIRDWDYIKKNGYNDHPTYYHGDIPNDLIEITNSQNYVREFLRRLFNPFYEFDLNDEE
jgi:hypothetical protein